MVEGRNRSRNLLPLSAVSSRKRLWQELGNECSRQEEQQQGKGSRTISSRHRYEKFCVNKTQNISPTFHVRTPSNIKFKKCIILILLMFHDILPCSWHLFAYVSSEQTGAWHSDASLERTKSIEYKNVTSTCQTHDQQMSAHDRHVPSFFLIKW